CQSDKVGYLIGDQLVSNFCFPAWFDATQFGRPGPFDFRRLMKSPFELLPGGYAMCRNLAGGEWYLVTSTDAQFSYTARPRVGSRRERRKTGLQNWLKSGVACGPDFTAADLVRPRL